MDERLKFVARVLDGEKMAMLLMSKSSTTTEDLKTWLSCWNPFTQEKSFERSF